MKRILALLLVLVMCVSVFAGCSKTEEQSGATLEQAKDYLYNIMKDKNDKATPNDYDVIGKLIIDETPFEVTWTTDNENIVVKASSKENCWTIDVPSVNEAEVQYTLTATIKNAEGNTIQVSFTPKLPVIANQGIITEPVAGVAYKLFFRQTNIGLTYYASNTTQKNENKFIEAKLDPKEAADFYVEAVNGGYKIYTEINGVKNYVHATATPKTGAVGYTKTIGFATETDSVFFYNSTLQTFYVEIGGEKFGVGTYSTYETICISELLKHFKEDNIEVKDGQFPVRFMESAYAETLTPDVIPPHVHEFVDGFCSCGEADPNATVTNQAPILTAETLGLGNYADGSKTLGGVKFDFSELGTYGNGIQWRTKDGKTSSLWNATATSLGIEKIEITLAAGKDGYTNTDALVITFGNSADNLSYRTTLSTQSGVAKYTITPDAGTYTFFKITHNFDKTVYIERIAIYYTGGATHEHNFVEGECVCGEKDPNYVPSHTCADANGDYKCDDASCTKVVAPAENSTLTIEQALALGALYESNKYTPGKYYVTGVISNTPNATYGNLNLTVDGKTIAVYGLWDATGANRYGNMTVKPVKGDTITVYTVVGQYNGTVQLKDAWTTAHTAHTCEYVDGACTVCGAADPNYVPSTPSHTCADADGDFKCDDAGCTKIVVPAENSTLTIEQALALGALYEHNNYTPAKYYVTGVIANTPNATYGNLNLTDGDKTIAVYGLWDAVGENRYGAMTVKPVKGDTITVYTVIGQYNNNVQLKDAWAIAHAIHTCEYVDGACTICGAVDPDAIPAHDEHIDGDGDFVCDINNCSELVLPAEGTVLTIAEALKIGALYKNDSGALYAPYKYYIVGKITDLKNAYGACDIEDATGTIYVYGLKDSTGEISYSSLTVKPVKGDTIKIYGQLGAYKNTAQFNNSNIIEHTPHTCEYVEGVCTACGADEPVAGVEVSTLNFTADNKTSFGEKTAAVWEIEGVKVTNAKGTYNNDLADYNAPARLYAGTLTTIECEGMTKIVFNVNATKYVSPLTNSLTDTASYTVTVNGNVVTVTFKAPTDSISFTASAQTRVDSIVVTH